ncbi:hypothetical protein N5V81_13215 [Escherichia coli]|nr:hypothetical protein [Escherichia coli]
MNKLDTTRDYYSSLMLTLPDSITGKTVGFVIGGIPALVATTGLFQRPCDYVESANLSVAKIVLKPVAITIGTPSVWVI